MSITRDDVIRWLNEYGQKLAENKDYQAAIADVNTANGQIQSLMLERFDDSTRMITAVTGFWEALKNRDLDKMMKAYPSGDFKGWASIIKESKELDVGYNLVESSINRITGKGSAMLDVTIKYGGGRVVNNEISQRWEFDLEKDKSGWLIEDTKVI